MKIFILGFSLVAVSFGAAAKNEYERTVFDQMPHERIMEIQLNECESAAQALGRERGAAYLIECADDIQGAFIEMKVLNEKRITPSMSWSICLNQTGSENTMHYPLLLMCMRTVNDVCPTLSNGEYVDFRKCVMAMDSGKWVANPKADVPIEP